MSSYTIAPAPATNLLALYRAWEAARGRPEQGEAAERLLVALADAEWGAHPGGVFVTARSPWIGGDPVRTLWVNGAAVARTRWLETTLWPLESRYVRTRAEAQAANRAMKPARRAQHEAYLASLREAVAILQAGGVLPYVGGQEGGNAILRRGKEERYLSARGVLRRAGMSPEELGAFMRQAWLAPPKEVRLPAHLLGEEMVMAGSNALAARVARRAGRRVRVRDL